MRSPLRNRTGNRIATRNFRVTAEYCNHNPSAVKGDHMRDAIKIYFLLFVVCVLALVVVVWLVPQVPLSLVVKVIIKVTLAYLAILFGLWLFGRRHL